MRKLCALAACLLLVAGCSSSGSSSGSGGGGGTSGAKFVAKVQQNSAALASDVNQLIAEAAAVDPLDDAGMTQLAADAQTLHGHLNDFKGSLILDIDTGNSDQSLMYEGEGDVKNAVGAINTWVGNPNGSTSASWQRQMADGLVKWNQAVTAIWSKAGAGTPPLIKLPPQ